MEEEKLIIKKNIGNPLEEIESILNQDEIPLLMEKISSVSIHDDVMDYLIKIVNETRGKENIELGVSPRGSISLFKSCQSYAAINGRDFILPEDIKVMAPYVLNHRIIARGVNTIEDALSLIQRIIDTVEVPLEPIGV